LFAARKHTGRLRPTLSADINNTTLPIKPEKETFLTTPSSRFVVFHLTRFRSAFLQSDRQTLDRAFPPEIIQQKAPRLQKHKGSGSLKHKNGLNGGLGFPSSGCSYASSTFSICQGSALCLPLCADISQIFVRVGRVGL
jgi:hypothetical protein